MAYGAPVLAPKELRAGTATPGGKEWGANGISHKLLGQKEQLGEETLGWGPKMHVSRTVESNRSAQS